MPLKPIDKKKNPGLAKLPTDVRNKMGYMKEGGAVKKKKEKEEKPQGLDPLGLMKPKKEFKTKPKPPENRRTPKVKPTRPKAFKEGGMVLEIGLRPATKQEMKMAKEMKPQKKANGGMVSRGTGQAIRGKGFKGVF
jgi:hypothetical protein